MRGAGDGPPPVEVPESEALGEGKFRATVPDAVGAALAEVIAIQARHWPVLRAIPPLQPPLQPQPGAAGTPAFGTGRFERQASDSDDSAQRPKHRDRLPRDRLPALGKRLPALRAYLAKGGSYARWGKRAAARFLEKKRTFSAPL